MTGSNWKPAVKRITALLLLTVLASGCRTSQPTLTIETTTSAVPCAALEPIRYSAKADTPETVQRVREFNAIFHALCN